MTLEDFFTLTEMKDGLAATSRVEELVTVMEKEKDSVVNPGDAIRQWTAVASILSATDNKDCLDLFVQLGGVWFIGRWLRDAEKFGSLNGDNFVEEALVTLLLALEKLCVDKERSISSGVWVAVKHLLNHHNVKVQHRARAVSVNWNHGDSDAISQQMDDSLTVNNELPFSGDVGREIVEEKCHPTSSPSHGEIYNGESFDSEAILVNNLPSQISDVTMQGVKNVQTMHNQSQVRCEIVADIRDGSFDPLLSSVATSHHDQDRSSDHIKDGQLVSVEETTSVVSCSPAPHASIFSKDDMVPMNSFPEDKRPVDKINSGHENLDSVGAAASFEMDNTSDAEAPMSEDTAAVSNVGINLHDEKNPCTEVGSVSDIQESAAEPQIENAKEHKAVEDNYCSSDVAKSSQDKNPVSDKLDNNDNSILLKEVGAAAKCKETLTDRYKEVSNLSALYGGRKGNKHSKKSHRKKSGIQLEYGILDALDIARQVAKEVEREVKNGTSSDRSSGGGVGQPTSPDSINKSPTSSKDTSSSELSTGQSQSAEDDGKSLASSDNGDNETKVPMADLVESPHMTDTKDKNEKNICEFDLNEVICSDDGGDKTVLNEESQDGSRQSLKHLEIDLNMAEEGEEAANFHATENRIPVSLHVVSKGSLMEPNEVRSDKLNLDLNSIDVDEDMVMVDHNPFNGLVYSSLSTSQMQPHYRNFDLNDQPYSSLGDHFSSRSLYQKSPTDGTISLGMPTSDPFISIMGKKVEVNKDNPISPRSSYWHDGKATLYTSPVGPLGLGAAPSFYPPLTHCTTLSAGNTVPFSLAPHFPKDQADCMVDPRVVPMIPGPSQGPASAFYSPYSVPFAMSLNPAGPSRPQLDLNTGFTVDGTHQNPGFLMQLFPPSQVNPTSEQPATFPHPLSGPVMGGKRKEPEGGWEPFPISYGQHQSPWK
ncbi:hypothetical protein SAY86_006809 [Trapa natans]|uniref:Uncharacterized protein n=1 Tax=Trapa natans TaxID=22666 RepID=A0AAN7QWH8_TRANT|nr:hypothetical protein SAY86_006809 [Trapa natans]